MSEKLKKNQYATQNLSPNRTVLARFDIRTEADLHIAVLQVQQHERLGEAFGKAGVTMLATVVSELGRNILKYGDSKGYLLVTWIEGGSETEAGLEIKAVDRGPGFADKERALDDHYSTSGTLGLGLPGVARIMDTVTIDSVPGSGAVVTSTIRIHRRDRKH